MERDCEAFRVLIGPQCVYFDSREIEGSRGRGLGERAGERAEKGYRFVWFNCDGSGIVHHCGDVVFGTVYQLVGSVFEDWDEWDGYRAGLNGNGRC